MKLMCSMTIVIAAMASMVHAQDKMAKPMNMGKEKSYTGCVEAGATDGTFKLSHAGMAMMGKDMDKDAMKKDSMKKDTMGKDAMGMSMGLMSKTVDLSKHVGHKVTVTGMDDKMAMGKDAMGKEMHGFSVTAVTMVAATCGM
ncbi:MAG: hypothetical protein ABI039_02630 [Vicinamibacterales bacterium]